MFFHSQNYRVTMLLEVPPPLQSLCHWKSRPLAENSQTLHDQHTVPRHFIVALWTFLPFFSSSFSFYNDSVCSLCCDLYEAVLWSQPLILQWPAIIRPLANDSLWPESVNDFVRKRSCSALLALFCLSKAVRSSSCSTNNRPYFVI